MSDILEKHEMSEEDIKLQYITPALTSKWDIKKITMETSPVNNFTDGKVRIKGNVPIFNNEESEGKTWFYRVDMPKGVKHFSKTKPMKLSDFDECVSWWNDRKEITDEDGNPKAKCYTSQELIDSGLNFDVCGYPHEEEVILSVAETIQNYEEKRSKLNADIDSILQQLTELHQKAQKGEL